MSTCIETKQVSKIFGGLTAVNSVDVVVSENIIASIIIGIGMVFAGVFVTRVLVTSVR